VILAVAAGALLAYAVLNLGRLRRLSRERDQLLAERDQVDNYFEIVGAMIIMMDPQGRIVRLNRKALDLLGADLETVKGEDWFSLFVPDENRPAVRARFDRLMSGEHGDEGYAEYAVLTARGEHRYTSWYRRVLRDNHGQVTGLLSAGIDDTERKRFENTLESLVLRDELTGLYNRRGFREVATQHIRLAARMHRAAFVLFLDVDDMKEINDTYGHGAGDRALLAVAEAMRTTLRQADVVARIGGDEFVALVLVEEEGDIHHLLDRLQTELVVHRPGTTDSLTVTFSLGVTQVDTDKPEPVDEYLALADREMYEAKRAREGA
jgi:diguanylate cyclase (GGDEF)-like protein/PAS domain S-box-containing protein